MLRQNFHGKYFAEICFSSLDNAIQCQGGFSQSSKSSSWLSWHCYTCDMFSTSKSTTTITNASIFLCGIGVLFLCLLISCSTTTITNTSIFLRSIGVLFLCLLLSCSTTTINDPSIFLCGIGVLMLITTLLFHNHYNRCKYFLVWDWSSNAYYYSLVPQPLSPTQVFSCTGLAFFPSLLFNPSILAIVVMLWLKSVNVFIPKVFSYFCYCIYALILL